MMPNKCTVTRDGHDQKVEAHELVPGDLVRLNIGDRVPADIRIIETADLKVAAAGSTHLLSRLGDPTGTFLASASCWWTRMQP